MRRPASENALRERRHEFCQWQCWRRERVEQLLSGPYAESARALLDFLNSMPSATALIQFVEAGPWKSASGDVRTEVLGLIDVAIIARREQMGLPPFDDALPGMPPNAFLILRERMR